MEPDTIYKMLVTAGNDWADKYGAWEVLDSATKPMLAQLTVEAKNLENCSSTEATSIAMSAHSYRDHLKATVEAHTAANKAKVAYDCLKVLSDLRRTQEASHRAAARVAP